MIGPDVSGVTMGPMLRAPHPPPASPAPPDDGADAGGAAGVPAGAQRHEHAAHAASSSIITGRQKRRFEWRRPPRGFLIGAAVSAFLLLVGAASFGPIVRARIAKEAERRKLDIEVGGVRPGFFAVALSDVRVRPRGVPGVEVRIDDVRVELGVTLSLNAVQARGGSISVDGEPEDVAQRLRDFRASTEKSGEKASDKASKTSLSAEELTLAWKLPSGGELSGAGIRLARESNALKLGCSKCAGRYKAFSVDVAGADVELARDGAPRRISASTMVVTHALPRAAAPPQAPSSASAEPAPPPLPVVHKRRASARGNPTPKTAVAQPTPAPDGPLLPLPDLHALRARIATAVAAFAPRLPDGATVEIGGLSAKLDAGGESMAFGPGTFTLGRRGDRVHVGFASVERTSEASARQTRAETKGAAGTPLSIDADLPLSQGEITARLAGGPVSLAALGVEDGMKGLTDVSRGTVSGKGQLVLSDGADALTFDGEVTLKSIAMKQPRLAPEPLQGLDFSLSARGVLDDHGKLRVDDAQLDMGALHARTHGTVEETADHFGVSLAIDVAPAACQALLDSSPQGLLPLVRSARMTGTFGASVNLSFDTRAIDKLALDYRIGDECRMLEVPRELSREHFEGAFTYRTYKPDGTIGEMTTGPGTPSWTALDDISPFMVAAVLTTEDGAFYKHKGFNHAAIRSSVQANLKARRFVRGASTITMQLAKNLFLARDKALSRKIEEVILTDYLEQIFRKDDMIELYLNMVEFGPDVYGVTQAAEYYFGRKPEELNVAECYFLATLLPSPIRYGKLRDKGEVPETWMRHLRALMEIGAKNGKITHAELEEGLKQSVVFMRSGDPRPEPRKPVTSSHRDDADDDAAWRPLD